ncbi:MAG: twin-arginine translocation signal domain-containing protein, partial [Acidobacteriota bacterium]
MTMKSSSNRRDFIKLGAAAGVFGGSATGALGQYGQAPQEETEVKNDLLLKDFEPHTCMVTPDTTPEKAKYPAIDAHIHIGAFSRGQTPEEYVKIMDATGVQSLINVSG